MMADIYEIDKQKTEQINSSQNFIPCSCDNCQRYYRTVEKLSPEGKHFFDTLGIDLLRCKELWCYHPNDKGCSHYSGYFSVVVKVTNESSSYSITHEWRRLDYGDCQFRIRLENDTNGKYILGFEADLFMSTDSG